MRNKDLKNHNHCHCSHCRPYGMRIIGGDDNSGKITRNADSYLMRGLVRNVSLSKHPSRLSVRWVRSGQYAYEVDGRNYVLQPGKFLNIADGEIYNSAVAENEVSEYERFV